MMPALLVLTEHFGIAGGAALPPILNGLYLLVGLPMTYRACLRSGDWPSFYAALAREQGPALALLAAARLAAPLPASGLAQGLALCALLGAAVAVSALASPGSRQALVAPMLAAMRRSSR
jgi:hypothetical protein